MFTARNIHSELAERVRGLGPGGIGAGHHLARRVGPFVPVPWFGSPGGSPSRGAPTRR